MGQLPNPTNNTNMNDFNSIQNLFATQQNVNFQQSFNLPEPIQMNSNLNFNNSGNFNMGNTQVAAKSF
jgi:hypothetical protein